MKSALCGAFESIISPLSRDLFLSDYVGKTFLRVPGHAGKLSSLLSWSELSSILEHHRLKPPRLRLFQQGKEIDHARFVSAGGAYAEIESPSLIQCLAAGATLIVDS